MGEQVGVLIAVLSSTLGGSSAGVTRFVIGALDPVTLGVFRYGGGFIVLLPIALAARSPWPPGRDWLAIAGLGLLFFGVFPVLYNLALSFTTAARGALALAMLPLLTMIVAAVLGIEPLTSRKVTGVSIATVGVALALAAGLAAAPAGAWRGDLVMIAAAFCMALYNVWSRPFIARSAPLSFTAASMGAGALVLVAIAAVSGGFAAVASFGTAQWLSVTYLGVFGSAAAFLLWSLALKWTTPTRVGITMTVNPIAASLVAAALIGEPIGLNLVAGVAAIFAGIWIASTSATRPTQPTDGLIAK